ncbi:hypothetical protein FJU30_09785 [Affinibrenneria salicis]|uniref:Uncharacterized protein n=2 Tax=Affinibrenneria salicis TaxID=2590031 RepID=A0A5J5G3Z2_9GAMM|nr:hypothetical protein FJU30_09785 [Affinibrenneria salicis]
MPLVDAHSFKEAKELIAAGIVRKIKLAFDINSDEFFNLAMDIGERGGKIVKKENHFILSIKKAVIPPND